MRYEKELMKLMPILKRYLMKIKSDYDNLIDMDDLYQECLLSAVKSSKKTGIKDPKNYFIGVFNNTIKCEARRKIEEFQRMNTIPVQEYWEDSEVGLIEAIDMQVKEMKPVTRRIWSSLKSFHGDNGMVRKALRCELDVVLYHKKKLKRAYSKVIEN